MNGEVLSVSGPLPTHHGVSLWRLRPFARRYLWHGALMICTALAATLVGAAIPLIIQKIIDGPLLRHDRGVIVPLGLLAFGFGAAEAALIFLRRWTMVSSSLGLESDLRQALYDHLQRLPTSFYDRVQSGQIVARLVNDLSQIRRFVGFTAIFIVVNAATLLIVGTLLVIADPWLGGLVLAGSAPLTWLMYHFEGEYRAHSRRVQDQQGELATLVEESAGGLRTIKAFGRHELVQERFHGQARRLQQFELAKVRLLAKVWALMEGQPQLVLTAVLLAGSVQVSRGAMTIGELVAFLSWFLLLIWPIESLGFLLASAQEANTATERLFEILDTAPEIVDPPHPIPLLRCRGRLQFHQVGLRYPGSSRPVLDSVELRLEPGETVAVVGATGTGKTTLAMLVPRLLDPTSGWVSLDGRDLRDLKLQSLRRQVAVAFEEPTLFSASVRENLLLGRPEASEEEIAEALAIAQAGFVHDLPWGLSTRVGEQGMSLSGGQRQRLALARAVLGRPPVAILDDPLSALDVQTERKVQRALRESLAESTCLLVAHRPSTILIADRVALLAGGRIAATGSHRELLAGHQLYRDLLAAEAELGAAS